MSCFASVGWTIEGWVIQPVKSHRLMYISAHFCRTAKSFGWLQNNFLRSSLNFPCLIAAEQHAYMYCSGDKIKFWSHLSEERPENLQKFIGILPAVASDRSKAQAEDLKSYINNMAKAFSWNTYFMSNLYSKKCHFTGKSIGDQLSTFATFIRFLLLSLIRFRPDASLGRLGTAWRTL